MKPGKRCAFVCKPIRRFRLKPKANAAKIPVVAVDTRVDDATLKAAGGIVTTFIGSDNEDGGRMAGAYLTERLGGTAKVAVLEGVPGHETADARLRGFRSWIL